MTQEEAIKTVERIFNYCEEIDYHLPKEEQTGYQMLPDINAVKEYIRNTAKVVKCIDCKYGKKRRNYNGILPWCDMYCVAHREFMQRNDFCSYGEREE